MKAILVGMPVQKKVGQKLSKGERLAKQREKVKRWKAEEEKKGIAEITEHRQNRRNPRRL